MAKKDRRRTTAATDSAPICPAFMGKPILPHDVLLALAGAALCVGVPYIMALFKTWGWW